jgi:FKBP-type peptidyl-prolyl cis-trans isomerase (trigger factor)
MSFTITKHGALPESEYEIEGEILAEVVKNFRPMAIKSFGEETKVDGFRPGHIPEKIIVDRFGEVAITEEAGRLALEKHYGEIIEKAIDKAKIKPLGSPAVTITKVAPGEAFGFKIKTALMPDVKVKGYAATAKKIMSEQVMLAVTDKEVDDAIIDLQKQVAHADHHEQNPEDHEHEHGDLPLPEINMEFIKKFGPFETVEAFTAKVKEGVTAEKTRKEKEKKRLKTMDELLAHSEVSMPKLLIESEIGRMLNELGSNLSQMGMNIEMYLKHINKTIEDLRKEWLPDAEKRAKTQLVLNQIALDEKITVPAEEIKKEVDVVVNHYKDADRTRAEIYIETVLLNEKVWQWLEAQGK